MKNEKRNEHKSNETISKRSVFMCDYRRRCRDIPVECGKCPIPDSLQIRIGFLFIRIPARRGAMHQERRHGRISKQIRRMSDSNVDEIRPAARHPRRCNDPGRLTVRRNSTVVSCFVCRLSTSNVAKINVQDSAV